REKFVSSDEENEKYRSLEKENKKLKEAKSNFQNEIEDLRKEKKRLKEELREKECEKENVVKSMQSKIDQLTKELTEQKGKICQESSTTVTKEPAAAEYSYEDDFEEESIASSAGESEKEEPSHVEEIASISPPSAATSNKYDDDTFEDASIAESVKSDARFDGDEGEICEESVADIIESDDESQRSDLFFGDRNNKFGNISFGVPQVSSVEEVIVDAPVKTPVTQFEAPSARFEAPASRVKSPIARDEIMIEDVTTPVLRAESPPLMLAKTPSSLLFNQEKAMTPLNNVSSLNANKNVKAGKPSKATKVKTTGQINAADIFGNGKSKKSGKKKNLVGESISAADIFGSAPSLKPKKGKKNKKAPKASNNLSATDIFGAPPSAKLNRKQSKDMNRDINSILGDL
uniref:Uncharacterized protein n=2 Tax=Clytia hemisphaerica TaxID=252671 RepID=A0A7M5X551_9CNID